MRSMRKDCLCPVQSLSHSLIRAEAALRWRHALFPLCPYVRRIRNPAPVPRR